MTTAAAAVLFVLFLFDGLYVAFQLRSSLRATATGLEEARDLFGADDPRAVEDALSDVLVSAGRAQSATAHPAFAAVTHLPFVGNDARAIESLSDAAALSARAGLSGIRAIEAASESGGGSLAAALYSDGVVNFRAADLADPLVREASRYLSSADDILQSVTEPRFDTIAEALETARDEISSANAAAEKAVAVLDGLPGLLGRDGVKEYFLAFQSPSEARGSGGFPGIYGVLRAEDGKLTLGKVRSIADLGRPTRNVPAPGWYQDLYRDAGALRDPRQAGYSPEFPTVANVWLGMYEAQTGQMLDGVIAMDPVAFGELTRATGPVSAPGLDREVGPDNSVRTLLYDSYVEFEDPVEQNRYLGGLIDALWSKLGSGDVDVQALGAGLSVAARGQHMKIYSIDDIDQQAIGRLGMDGTYSDEGENVQLVYNNNAGANKIDYFLKRSIDTTIALQDDGSTVVKTTITMTNDVPPDAPKSLVFGPGIEGDEAGDNGMVLSVLMPQGSQLRGYYIDGKRSPALQGREGDYAVAYDLVVVPAGGTSQVQVNYVIRDAWVVGSGVFDFVLYPQATVIPDDFRLAVEAPTGTEIRSVNGSDVADVSKAEMSGTLEEPRRYVVLVN